LSGRSGREGNISQREGRNKAIEKDCHLLPREQVNLSVLSSLASQVAESAAKSSLIDWIS
jgi:hypothetical protein